MSAIQQTQVDSLHQTRAAKRMLDDVHNFSPVTPRPYRTQWAVADTRRYFARSGLPLAMKVLDERIDDGLIWREVSFVVAVDTEGLATVVLPVTETVRRGVVLAHGGGQDGRRFFRSEAAALAAQGAVVALPATRMRTDDGVDTFVADVRVAVLTERAALDVLIEFRTPADALSFLGHSAGGALGAVLGAVEPRLAGLVIFANGDGVLFRDDLTRGLSHGGPVSDDAAAVSRWLDPANYIGVDRRAKLLIQHGRADQTVPIQAARALFDAAANPKLWADYDWDHGLDADPRARADRAQFVATGELLLHR